MLNHVVSEVVTHRVDIPLRTIEQPLDALRPGLTQVFGHLPAVLPLHPIQQPSQIALRTFSGL
jgi:hypothetical protein